jgi:hypothetical protein
MARFQDIIQAADPMQFTVDVAGNEYEFAKISYIEGAFILLLPGGDIIGQDVVTFASLNVACYAPAKTYIVWCNGARFIAVDHDPITAEHSQEALVPVTVSNTIAIMRDAVSTFPEYFAEVVADAHEMFDGIA